MPRDTKQVNKNQTSGCPIDHILHHVTMETSKQIKVKTNKLTNNNNQKNLRASLGNTGVFLPSGVFPLDESSED